MEPTTHDPWIPSDVDTSADAAARQEATHFHDLQDEQRQVPAGWADSIRLKYLPPVPMIPEVRTAGGALINGVITRGRAS